MTKFKPGPESGNFNVSGVLFFVLFLRANLINEWYMLYLPCRQNAALQFRQEFRASEPLTLRVRDARAGVRAGENAYRLSIRFGRSSLSVQGTKLR